MTPFVNTLVRDNALNIYINEMFLGVSVHREQPSENSDCKIPDSGFLVLEEENCRLAGLILESTDESDHVVQLAESSGRH